MQHRGHTYIHTYINTYINTYIPTYLPTYLHTYIPTHLHTYTPTYLRTYVPMYLRTYVPTYLRTYVPTYLRTYLRTYVPTYLPTYVPTYICTYVHRKMQRRQSDPVRRRASADIYGSSESTTPATQIEPEVPKVPRLPRKRPRRHISPTSSPSFRRHLWWYRKDRGATSVLLRRQASDDIYGGTEKTVAPHQSYFVAKLPLTSMTVQKAPRLPRKSSLRCRRCHACHAKDRGATSVLLRRQASADIYDGTESTTPATQIEPEVPKVPRLPRERPRRRISPTSSPSFR